MPSQVTSYPISTLYEATLPRELEEFEDIEEILYHLRMAGPNDQFTLNVNGVGGSVDLAMELIVAMEESAALVVTKCSGSAYSSHSLVLFCGDVVEVHETAEILAHDSSGGPVGGKLSESRAALDAGERRIRAIYEKCYANVLTKGEIDSVLKGQDIVLLGYEVAERMANYAGANVVELETDEVSIN